MKKTGVNVEKCLNSHFFTVFDIFWKVSAWYHV